MALRHILTYPKYEAILRTKAKPIKRVNAEIRQLIRDLKETWKSVPAYGLAAPQIGELWRAFVFGIPDESPEPVAVINPRIITARGAEKGFDACLSIPGFKAETTRATEIDVEYTAEDGHTRRLTLSELRARIFQHESDHLDGILYLDRLASPEDLYALIDTEQGTVAVPANKLMARQETL